MRFRVLRSFCLKPGQDVYEGDLIELEAGPGRRWERLGCLASVRESEVPPDPPAPAAPGPALDAVPDPIDDAALDGARETDVPTEGGRRRRRPS
jgi:hypothetical protein